MLSGRSRLGLRGAVLGLRAVVVGLRGAVLGLRAVVAELRGAVLLLRGAVLEVRAAVRLCLSLFGTCVPTLCVRQG